MASHKSEEQTNGQSRMPKMWEYRVEWLAATNGDNATQDQLNELGSEGWELVTVQAIGGKFRGIFKRRLRVSRKRTEG